jgi:hypothetical protein
MSMASLPAGSNSPVSGSPQTWAEVSLGQAAPISAEAAALVDYSSPNQTGVGTEELDEDPELAKLRGTAKIDE